MKKIFLIFTFFFLFPAISLFAKPPGKIPAKDVKDVTSVNYEYQVPSRAIYLTPYVSYIYAKGLFTDVIEDQSALGGGLIIDTQIYKNFGYMFDLFGAKMKIRKDESLAEGAGEGLKGAAVISAGFYYAIKEVKIDLCYGAIIAGNYVMTIMIPAVEYSKMIYNRISLFGKIDYLITNDWIVNMKYKELYSSFSLSVGVSVLF